jgi:hypothetical protein
MMGLLFGSVPPALAMAAPALPLLAGAALAAFSGTPRRKVGRLDVAVTPASPAGAG